jgi:PiT family inorganic phosphate transporter
MLASVAPSSPAALAVLVFCFVLVLSFEVSNGFHDTANAVATVIYTHALRPRTAVLLSGILNFAGVLLGGVAVAFTLVELLPPDVLTPPNGNPAIGMLLALFTGALLWNVATWWLGIPCSSSHAVIGSLLGVAVASAILAGRHAGQSVDWKQVWGVLRALAVSPLLGFIGAGILFRIVHRVVRDRHLFEPTTEGRPPVWWVRWLLIATCSGVSFAHGSNDGQKSIGLIMLTIIGILPAQFTLNFAYPSAATGEVAAAAERTKPLIERYGDDQKELAIKAADALAARFRALHDLRDVPNRDRSAVRDDVYRILAELKHVTEAKSAQQSEKQEAGKLRTTLHNVVEYAPVWVRLLSAFCLGTGTMIGYRRIVVTIGERIGKQHLTPAQGASAELVGAALIGTAGFSGLPVSTTHIISSGVAGTMAGAKAGVQTATVRQIIIAWLLTLPATVLLSGTLFWLLVG